MRHHLADTCFAVGVAAAALVIALFFAPRGYQAGFVDMGHDGYQLRQAVDLSDGGVIFRDTFDQYGPLHGYFNQLGFRALGHRLLSIKYFVCGWYAVIAVLMFVLARRWLSPVLAAFATLVWLALAPFYQHGIMISPHMPVLLLQIIAALLLLGHGDRGRGRMAVVGLLAGLAWSMKQSLGALFLASILLFLAACMNRTNVRSTLMAASTMVVTFAASIVAVLAWLSFRGALHDWYLQTIAFPRDFYIAYYGRQIAADAPALVPPIVTQFIRLQLAQAPYWIAIRGVVIVAGVWLAVRRTNDDLVLIASMTALFWLAAFPSANFMHQWWTASIAIPASIWCVYRGTRRFVAHRTAAVLTMAVVLVVLGPTIRERRYATSFRASSLSATLDSPPLLRGIRTDPPMKRAIETLADVILRFRAHHPSARLLTIDSADGTFTGVNESLLFLTAVGDNPHPHAVYWSLPVLTTVTYPNYQTVIARTIETEHPLLIEQRDGAYAPRAVPGYVVLAAVQSDFGFWYLYAPDHDARVAHGEVSLYLARDGASSVGFVEAGRAPEADRGLSPNPVGGQRHQRDGATALYTWPADLSLPVAASPIEALGNPVSTAPMVQRTADGGWSVDGFAAGRFDSLIEFADRTVDAGATLIARGALREGGLQVGFEQNGEWIGFVTVTDEGPFEAVLQIQRAGRYKVVLAHCIESTTLQTIRRHWADGSLMTLVHGLMPNRFQLTSFGWQEKRVQAPATQTS